MYADILSRWAVKEKFNKMDVEMLSKNVTALKSILLNSNVHGSESVSLKLGHLQSLGSKGPRLGVDSVNGFPTTKDFFEKYVFQSKPVKMTGAVKDSFEKIHWTDEHFLSLQVPKNHTLSIGNTKKQDRHTPSVDMTFHKFVQQYKHTDQRMDVSVPDFLGKEVSLPASLHCEEIYQDKIIDVKFRLNSGGTTSMLHTDSAEDIVCVYSGQQQFVMINPHKYFDKVDIDFPVTEMSGVDVDRVDYDKYPGLADVEFTVVNISAGDCLYMPYKWFHYIRTYSRNIAVSTWWEYQQVNPIDITKCTGLYDEKLTVDKIEFQYTRNAQHPVLIKDFFLTITTKGPVSTEQFTEILLREYEVIHPDLLLDHNEMCDKMIGKLDKDGNGMISRNEVITATEQDWEFVANISLDMELMVQEIQPKGGIVSIAKMGDTTLLIKEELNHKEL